MLVKPVLKEVLNDVEQRLANANLMLKAAVACKDYVDAGKWQTIANVCSSILNESPGMHFYTLKSGMLLESRIHKGGRAIIKEVSTDQSHVTVVTDFGNKSELSVIEFHELYTFTGQETNFKDWISDNYRLTLERFQELC